MYKDLKEFVQSKLFRGILMGIGIAIVVLFIFQAGVAVGYRKAAFAFRFGDNYYRAFGDHGPRLFQVPVSGGFIEAHGAAGRVVSINLPTFVMADRDNLEKVVLISDDTIVRRLDETVQPSDLLIDDFAVVLGSPNEDSQIEAKLIRIFPLPLKP
jgi:hypothetical protein